MKTTPIDHYTPRPLRESREHKTAEHIQQDIDLMRAMYAQRRNLNHARHESVVGWSLVAVAIALPVIVAIAILI